MPFGETEADQTVALPYCDRTRCEAPYAEPEIPVDRPLRAAFWQGVFLAYLAAIGAAALWVFANTNF